MVNTKVLLIAFTLSGGSTYANENMRSQPLQTTAPPAKQQLATPHEAHAWSALDAALAVMFSMAFMRRNNPVRPKRRSRHTQSQKTVAATIAVTANKQRPHLFSHSA